MLETPVAFLIFNRPDTTAKVFAEIARAKPRRLLVIADGARSENEAIKCAAARSIIERVDWDCEVSTNFSEVNLGCKHRVASGLNWVFENCEEAIILEDDCLPHPSFFRYCAELLNTYRHDERITGIGGSNFQAGNQRGAHSYYFSRYAHIWGWASWRRAWQHYDLEMSQWPVLREGKWLQKVLGDKAAAKHWRNSLDKCFAGEIDTWDLQWFLCCQQQSGLTVLPNINLISNIGFGAEATHTKTDIYGVSEMAMDAMTFPLSHPTQIIPDEQADQFTFKNLFAKETDQSSVYRKMGRKVLSLMPKFVQDSMANLRAR
jgi:hypothetical protein